MSTPTFTCDRCGKGTRLRLNVAYHMICKPCFEAVCRDIDQFAGEGAYSSDTREKAAKAAGAPSLVPLVDRLREWAESMSDTPLDLWRWDLRDAADRIEELEADNADLRRAIELAEDPEFVLRHRELEKLIEAGEVSIGMSADEFRQRYIGKDRPADLASDDRLIPLPGGRVAVAAQDLRVGDALDQFAGEGAGGGSAVVETLHSGSPASEMRTDAVPSPVPAAPSLVERLRDAYRIKHHVLVHEAADRIEKLERWKSEGMIVLGEWDRVYEALGKPGKLGESKALAALARVKKLHGGTDE